MGWEMLSLEAVTYIILNSVFCLKQLYPDTEVQEKWKSNCQYVKSFGTDIKHIKK